MRKGLIKITDDFYQKEWDYIYHIFKYFRPSHIEFRHWENDIWYFYGHSEMFDELKESEVVPEYSAIFSTDSDKQITFQKFQRI